MPRTKKPKQGAKRYFMLINPAPLMPFIETDTELPKETLIQRCAGKVERSVLNILKMSVFYRIGRDTNGIYIL